MATTPSDSAPAQEGELRRQLWPSLGSSLAVAGGLGMLEVLRGRVQQSHVFRNRSRYPEGTWDPSPRSLPFEDVLFRSEDGVLLHGWWIEHREPRAALVYCHGRSGSIAHRIPIYRHLRRLGFSVFAFDYRGYGRSSGHPSEKGLYADVRAAVDTVTGQLGVDPRRVILFGHSLGGAVAIDGALERRVAGLVVESSFTDLRDMARGLSPRLPLHLITRNAFRSIEKVPKIGVPKLFLHGTADTTVPIGLGERLFAAAAEPKRWVAVESADHEDLHRRDRRRYFQSLLEHSESCTGGAPLEPYPEVPKPADDLC